MHIVPPSGKSVEDELLTARICTSAHFSLTDFLAVLFFIFFLDGYSAVVSSNQVHRVSLIHLNVCVGMCVCVCVSPPLLQQEKKLYFVIII